MQFSAVPKITAALFISGQVLFCGAGYLQGKIQKEKLDFQKSNLSVMLVVIFRHNHKIFIIGLDVVSLEHKIRYAMPFGGTSFMLGWLTHVI